MTHPPPGPGTLSGSSKGLAFFFAFGVLADSEDVPVGVSYMQLANMPRHVNRRPRYFESHLEAAVVHGIDIVHPY